MRLCPGASGTAPSSAEERRLACPVRAEDGDPLAPPEHEVDRAEPEGAAIGDGARQLRYDVPFALRHTQVEPELPRPPGLFDLVQTLEPLLRRAHLRGQRVRGAPVRLPSAGASVTAPLGQEGGEPRPFLLVAAKGRFVTLVPDGSQPLVFRPAARVEARPAGLGFELEHAVHRPLQKRAVVRDAHDSAVEPADERLQAVEAIEIEIVRRLVQEQDIGPHEEGRREPNPSLLAAREPGERTSEIGAQPELGGRPGPALPGRRPRPRRRPGAPRRTRRRPMRRSPGSRPP